jgi:hypothetical protein
VAAHGCHLTLLNTSSDAHIGDVAEEIGTGRDWAHGRGGRSGP